MLYAIAMGQIKNKDVENEISISKQSNISGKQLFTVLSTGAIALSQPPAASLGCH